MKKLTNEQKNYLNDLYYKQHYYFGRDKIYMKELSRQAQQ